MILAFLIIKGAAEKTPPETKDVFTTGTASYIKIWRFLQF